MTAMENKDRNRVVGSNDSDTDENLKRNEGFGGADLPNNPTPLPSKLHVNSLMAPSYIPQEYRRMFQIPANVWQAQPLPNHFTDVHRLYFTAVEETPKKSHVVPWLDLPGMAFDPYFAIGPAGAARSRPDFNRKFDDVGNGVKSLQHYVNIFCKLLEEEYCENMDLYERYTQYNLPIKTAKVKAGREDQVLRAMVEISGIFDARPTLQSGDTILLRPMFSEQMPTPTEVHATVVNTARAKRPNQKDSITITWIPKSQASIFQKAKFGVRLVPSSTHYDRCLAALKWLQTGLDTTTAKELLYPSNRPKVSFVEVDRSHLPELQRLNDEQSLFVNMVYSRSQQPTTELVRAPMILTGPAGTGKTKTLLAALLVCLEKMTESSQVETKQETTKNTKENVWKQVRDSDDCPTNDGQSANQIPSKRALVCTPSHTACDVITRRLGKHLGRKRLFRLYDINKPVEAIPVEILEFTRQGPDGEFVLPTIEEFLGFQVIVCTCVDAHLLFLSGMTNKSLRSRRQSLAAYVRGALSRSGMAIHVDGAENPYFTHLFIDEAAQASEPETLIPLSVVVDDALGIRKAEVALSGDPRQLNPDVHSRFAGPGLQKSFLERLLRLPDFGGRNHLMGPPTKDTWRTLDELIEYSFQDEEKDTRERLSSVFLRISYRGHPSFLHVPSKLFYLDKLKSLHPEDKEDATWCRALRKLEMRSNPAYKFQAKQYSWPMHFTGVLGRDVSLAVESFWGSNSWCNREEAISVAETVRTLCSNGVSSMSIGVMAAFRAQVLYIRRLLREQNLGGVNVGLVEDYQGVERDVIVLSLTRSNENFVPLDIDRNSGLFQQPKRVNVALTRVDHLFIVVGNPNTMKNDPLWSVWLDFCRTNGFWYGEKATELTLEHKI